MKTALQFAQSALPILALNRALGGAEAFGVLAEFDGSVGGAYGADCRVSAVVTTIVLRACVEPSWLVVHRGPYLRYGGAACYANGQVGVSGPVVLERDGQRDVVRSVAGLKLAIGSGAHAPLRSGCSGILDRWQENDGRVVAVTVGPGGEYFETGIGDGYHVFPLRG